MERADAAENERLKATLDATTGRLMNLRIDLETGGTKAKAIGTLDCIVKQIRAALAHQDAPHDR